MRSGEIENVRQKGLGQPVVFGLPVLSIDIIAHWK